MNGCDFMGVTAGIVITKMTHDQDIVHVYIIYTYIASRPYSRTNKYTYTTYQYLIINKYAFNTVYNYSGDDLLKIRSIGKIIIIVPNSNKLAKLFATSRHHERSWTVESISRELKKKFIKNRNIANRHTHAVSSYIYILQRVDV